MRAWKKKGYWELNDILILLGEVVIVGVSVLFLYTNMLGVAESPYLERIFYTKDIGLLVSAMIAAPGNIEASYVTNTSGFEMNFTQYRIALSDQYITYPYLFFYGNNPDINIVDLRFKKSPQFIKSGNTLTVIENHPDRKSSLYLPCVSEKSKKRLGTIPLIIDPGKDFADPGFIHPNSASITEANLMYSLSESLRITPAFNVKRSMTRTKTGTPTEEERLEKLSGNQIVISLHAGKNSKTTKQEIIAYVPPTSDKRSKESHALACSILNAILKEMPTVTGVGILSGNQPELFQNQEAAIFLKIGNINTPLDQSILRQPGKLSKSIAIGFSNYYESPIK